jgi:flagellar L-ring protein precursor FlgH
MKRQRHLIVPGLLLALAASGCAGVRPAGDGPVVAEPPTPRTVAVHPEAPGPQLWQASNNLLLFPDLRAREVGDVLTVNIVETAKASKQATTKTGRDSSVDAGVDAFLGYENWAKDRLNQAYGFKPEQMVKGSLSSSFEGSGTTVRDEQMTASMSVRVVQVLPSGNLVIRGSRHVRVNHEDQVIVLSGIVRPEDVSPDNTILSSYIADARIEYYGKGVVSEKQRPGWMARVLDVVWPF